MTDQPQDEFEFNELSMSDRVDVVCDAFEKEILAGRQPRIKDFLSGFDEPERSSLSRELQAISDEHSAKHSAIVETVSRLRTGGLSDTDGCGIDKAEVDSKTSPIPAKILAAIASARFSAKVALEPSCWHTTKILLVPSPSRFREKIGFNPRIRSTSSSKRRRLLPGWNILELSPFTMWGRMTVGCATSFRSTLKVKLWKSESKQARSPTMKRQRSFGEWPKQFTSCTATTFFIVT